MKCNYCNSSWTSDIQHEKCPFCGEALPYYKILLEKGDVKFYELPTYELFDLGNSAYNDQEYESAVYYYRFAAGRSHMEAQVKLARCYELGIGVSKDLEEAVYYYKLAAGQGSAYASGYLAMLYYYGKGVKKDYKEAVFYCVLAVSQNDAFAQDLMGAFYFNGDALEKDLEKSFYYYNLAAKQNYAGSQYMLGWFYENGIASIQKYAVSQDALRWFNSNYMFVDKDLQKAISYYRLAAKQGDSNAVAALKRLDDSNNTSGNTTVRLADSNNTSCDVTLRKK